MRGLTTEIQARLDARLQPQGRAPIAVALSGGSDSLALTLIAADWARAHGRRLLVLTVDHGLQPQSLGWTRACAAHAARLGVPFRALAWTGDKPETGLPAAARAARHRLLAEAAREAGARVILLGHTADDRAEAALMRQEGGTTPDPREWAPSPVWPEGRGVFLLRPMLGAARADLRAWLAARGETWIEDPANQDLHYARARARAAGAPAVALAPPPATDLADLARLVAEETGGGLTLDRAAFRRAGPAAARALAGVAALCAAGTTRPPRSDPLERLAEALRGDAPVVATLAGARIEADAGRIAWRREAGELRRAGAGPLEVPPGETLVWDGRFEVRSRRPVVLAPLAGQARRLSPEAARALARLPASARGALPAALVDEAVLCPAVEPVEGLELRALSLERLHAACGLTEREP